MEIHKTLTTEQDTANPANPMTGSVPFQAERNPDGRNFNNENANTFFTGDQANQQTVASSVINVPDDAAGTSAVSPPTVRPGPEPDTTPGKALEINLSTRSIIPALGVVPLPHGIPFYDGVPNVQPEGEFANAINKFPRREN